MRWTLCMLVLFWTIFPCCNVFTSDRAASNFLFIRCSEVDNNCEWRWDLPSLTTILIQNEALAGLNDTDCSLVLENLGSLITFIQNGTGNSFLYQRNISVISIFLRALLHRCKQSADAADTSLCIPICRDLHTN